MINEVAERRLNLRYKIHLPVHFRVSFRSETSRWRSSVIADISSTGISFPCRQPLPIGAHVEMLIDWPAHAHDSEPIQLHAGGYVVRRSSTKAGVRITSHRFRVELAVAAPMGAIA